MFGRHKVIVSKMDCKMAGTVICNLYPNATHVGHRKEGLYLTSAHTSMENNLIKNQTNLTSFFFPFFILSPSLSVPHRFQPFSLSLSFSFSCSLSLSLSPFLVMIRWSSNRRGFEGEFEHSNPNLIKIKSIMIIHCSMKTSLAQQVVKQSAKLSR